MAAHNDKVLRLVAPPADTGRLLAQGLVDLYKAVKGASFYPDGHPYRTAPLERSFEALARLSEKRELVITVTRQGFTPGLEAAEGNPMLRQLARECLMRRIAGITFSRGLLACDLEAFVQIMANDPQKIASTGGFARRLQAAGAQSVKIQEKDLSSIWGRRRSGAGNEKPEGAAREESVPALPAQQTPPETAQKHDIPKLLQLMASEDDDARYQELGRELVERFLLEQLSREAGQWAPLPVLEELLRQHQDAQKSVPQREYAFFTLERLAEGTAEFLVEALERRDCPDREGIVRVLAALGRAGAYRIIQRLCLAQEVYQRKALASALVRLGPAAAGPVTEMLKDERWYVVRNMVTILGELRCPEAVPSLRKPLQHVDQRVRKESVRALMKIGGEVAEATLVGLVEDQDQAVARQAILSLGLMHSRLAVAPLLRLLERRDLLLKTFGLKKEIVLALGRIGDRSATPALLKVLASGGFPVFGRSLELKIGAASALGALRDESALAALRALAERKGRLAEACREAVDAIERVTGGAS